MTGSVSAIVVNWNGASHLPDCLDSLHAQTYAPLEVIVVDNGSADDSEALVRATSATWLPLGANVGLAPAFNAGATAATGELLLFLNNDMRFAPDFVERMVACLERHPGCGAVDAVQLAWEDERVVHASTRLGPRGEFVAADPVPDGLVVFPSGANTLIRRSTFDELGGWDPRFLAGHEDVDLGWRVWLSGRTVRLASDAVCWHKVGASSTSELGAAVRADAAVHGPLLFALKHAPVPVVLRAVARFVVATLVAPVRSDRAALRRRSEVARRLVAEAPAALRWRRAAYRAAHVTTAGQWRKLQNLP